MEANQNLVLILFPQVPNVYLRERKRFLLSNMMNPRPQDIQKREIVVVNKVKNKYKPDPNLGHYS